MSQTNQEGLGIDDLGRPGYLIDAVAKIPNREDSLGAVEDDVKAAMRAVGSRETRERVAADIGLAGARAVRQWDQRVDEVGPRQAVAEAAHLYQRQPKHEAPKREGNQRSEPRNDWDHVYQAARDAIEHTKQRDRVRADMPQTMAELAAIEQRHGSLDVIERRKIWNEGLATDPADAAPRIEAELAQEQQRLRNMPVLQQVADQYLGKNKVSDPEFADMLRVLETGELPRTGDNQIDLQNAHQYAAYVNGADIKDDYQRDVIAAERRLGGVELWLAHGEVAQWEAAHPKFRRGSPVARRMQELLENTERTGVRTLDEAYYAVTGKR